MYVAMMPSVHELALSLAHKWQRIDVNFSSMGQNTKSSHNEHDFDAKN